MYYSIGEVAEMFAVNTSLIRFWEKEFKQIKPKKNSKGNRLFTPKDILVIQQIYQLVKIEGFTLEGAKKISLSTLPVLEKNKDQEQSIISRLELVRNTLLKLKN